MNDGSLDQKKFDLMWKQILDYEKEEGFDKGKTANVNKIVSIIDEVFNQWY